ncbi:MAG TPA: rhodanese-like domain-containing protein [Methylomirabilota bacterium]|nr:rhodanese-like domain-containing protein [Methylomirabilota bacterium]
MSPQPPRAAPVHAPGRRGGRRRAAPAGVAVLLALASALGSRPARAIHTAADTPLAIAAEDVERYRAGGEEVTVIDLRHADDYRRGHVPGARSIPLEQLRRRQAEVPPAGRVVLYAASPAEATAAYQALRDAGFRNVMLLAGGLAGWTRAGLALETGP